MSPRNRPPGPGSSQLASEGFDHDVRIELTNPMRPWFRFTMVGSAANSVTIATKPTLTGDSLLLLPFRAIDTGWTQRRPIVLSVASAIITLSSTGLAINGGTGGRVDGIAVAANTDYLLWGFAYPPEAPAFVGFGITTRPRIAATTSLTGGTVGSSTTFTVAAGEGFRFTVGARILAREGTAIGNDYNQGTITAVTSTTIVATLDAAYVGLGAEANATIASPVEILQLDNFQPTVPAQATTFGPTTTEPYLFTYLGLIQTDSASTIRDLHRPGDFYLLQPGGFLVATSIVAGAVTLGLGRWIPIDQITEIIAQVVATRTSAAGTLAIADLYHPENNPGARQTAIAAANGAVAPGEGIININPRYSSVARSLTLAALTTGQLDARIRSYRQEKW